MLGRLVAVCAAILLGTGSAFAQPLGWTSFDPVVATALHAFRQTDHRLADAMNENMEGTVIGRDRPGWYRPPNFNPAEHLSWVVADLNRDGRAEVFLLVEWAHVSGNNLPPGIVLQQIDRYGEQWRVACEFEHDRHDSYERPNHLRLLDRRSHGWRHFRVLSGTYGWRPAAEGNGAMECVKLTPRR